MAIRRRRAGHHPHRHKVRGFGYFSHLGPGIVTGASDDDPSGIGTYSQIGASFRFGLLWTAPFTLPLAAAMQEAAARLGLVTGRGLAALIKQRFPTWVLLGAVALVSIANVFNIGADLGAMAASIGLVVAVARTLRSGGAADRVAAGALSGALATSTITSGPPLVIAFHAADILILAASGAASLIGASTRR